MRAMVGGEHGAEQLSLAACSVVDGGYRWCGRGRGRRSSGEKVRQGRRPVLCCPSVQRPSRLGRHRKQKGIIHPSLSFKQTKTITAVYFLFEIQPHYSRHLAMLMRSTSNPISPWNFLNFLNTAATDGEARGRSVRLVVVALLLLWLGRHCQHVTHARPHRLIS